MFRRQTDLLSLISNPNGTSRIELARGTGGSSAKIGKIVQRLLAAGILTEQEPIETSRGRRPILLKPSKELGFLMGVDIGLVNLRVVLADLQGEVLAGLQTPSPHARVDIATALKGIFQVADSVLERSGLPRDKLLAVGVSHSGAVDIQTGRCLYWHLAMQWKGVDLKQVFAHHYGVPCEIDDAVHCMAIAEKVYGAARNENTFVMINVGWSISAALFIEGELFRGATGIAGEIGHNIVLPEGPRCYCGNRGCLEILASGKSVVDKAIAALNENTTTALQEVAARGRGAVTLEAVCAAARSGDRLAGRLLREAGGYIGIAVGNIVNLLNPPLIVLAGGMMSIDCDRVLLEVIRREAGASAFEVAFAKTKIVNSPLDRLSAARGAALRATRSVLRNYWNRVFEDRAME